MHRFGVDLATISRPGIIIVSARVINVTRSSSFTRIVLLVAQIALMSTQSSSGRKQSPLDVHTRYVTMEWAQTTVSVCAFWCWVTTWVQCKGQRTKASILVVRALWILSVGTVMNWPTTFTPVHRLSGICTSEKGSVEQAHKCLKGTEVLLSSEK